jgi:hypothetical protein
MAREWTRVLVAAVVAWAVPTARAAALTPPLPPPATGAITTAATTADGTLAAISGWVEFTGCPERCQKGRLAEGWLPVVTVQPDSPEYACTGNEARDQDPNTQNVLWGTWSAQNGRWEFDRDPIRMPYIGSVQAKRLCLSVVYWDGGYYAGGYAVDSRPLPVGDVKPMPLCGSAEAAGQPDCETTPCTAQPPSTPCRPEMCHIPYAFHRLCEPPPPRRWPLKLDGATARSQANRALLDRFRSWRGNRRRTLTCREYGDKSWLCKARWRGFGRPRARDVWVATYDGKSYAIRIARRGAPVAPVRLTAPPAPAQGRTAADRSRSRR